MFYKVIHKNNVIDVLDRLVYLKHQQKHDRMLLCRKDEAQAIFSSDMERIWHVEGMYDLPVDGYDTVELVEIDEHEYKKLKVFCGKSIEDVIDEFVELTLGNEIELLMDSLKRLYDGKRIDESKVIELHGNNIITDEQMGYVLGN